MDKETKKAIEQTEKTVYRIEQDTIKISKQLKELEHTIKKLTDRLEAHIEFIDKTYEGLRNPINVAKKWFRR